MKKKQDNKKQDQSTLIKNGPKKRKNKEDNGH